MYNLKYENFLKKQLVEDTKPYRRTVCFACSGLVVIFALLHIKRLDVVGRQHADLPRSLYPAIHPALTHRTAVRNDVTFTEADLIVILCGIIIHGSEVSSAWSVALARGDMILKKS